MSFRWTYFIKDFRTLESELNPDKSALMADCPTIRRPGRKVARVGVEPTSDVFQTPAVTTLATSPLSAGGRIRTCVALRRQIYSLVRLPAPPPQRC